LGLAIDGRRKRIRGWSQAVDADDHAEIRAVAILDVLRDSLGKK
jgi:hypothetical protein